MTHCSVLVCGAGPTGLVLAYELSRRGVATRIIDARAERAHDSKAIAVQAKTLEMLDLMGVSADALRKQGHLVGRGIIYAQGGEHKIASLDFSKLPSRYREMLLVPQWQTESFLEDNLGALGLRVQRGRTLRSLEQRPDAIEVRVETSGGSSETITADWLAGCDGGHSSVRDLAQIPFDGSTYPNVFALADVHLDGRLDQDRFVVFTHEEGPLAIFPLGGGRYRVIADNPPPAFREQPSLEACQAILDQRGPGGLKMRDAIWISSARIHRRSAGQLRKGRVFIAGDAANIHSPAGGQGMNTGMQDAFNLGWKLASAVKRCGSEALLESYEVERQPVEEAVSRASDLITRLVALQSPVARFLRDHLAPALTELASVQARLTGKIAELGIDYRHSNAVIDRHIAGSELRAGDAMPDILLDDKDPKSGLFAKVALGRHVTLLVGKAGPQVGDLWIGDLDWSFVRMRSGSARTSWGGTIKLGSKPGLYVIRPDGFIGLRCPASAAAHAAMRDYRALIS
jgi:2-polyprenyl-6-methoxyphenol hydroxylase-like FAD-dependent oxidoreductase